MSDEIKALVEQIQVQVQSAHSFADRPLYNSLETGFRHTPLTPKEREQRYQESCRFAAQDSQEALRLIGELRAALTAQADEIERLRAALNATADEQDERSAAWERAIAAGLKRMTVSKDYARGAHNESQVAAIKIRAALKAAQEVKP